MPADMRVRPATSKDVPQVTRLWRELIGYHEALGGQDFRLAPGAEQEWARYLRGHIKKSRRMCVVAETDARIVGFLLASIDSRPGIFMEREYGHISDVYVQAPHRRKGIGKALVDAALRWFEERRVSRVRLKTDARNILGVEFWKELGFETTVFTMDKLM